MKLFRLSVLLGLFPVLLFGQNLHTISEPNIEFLPIQHATFMIKTDSLVIYIDPFGGKSKFENLPAPDLILITDIHGDHFNIETLSELKTENALFVVPKAVADKMPDQIKNEVTVLKNGENAVIKEISIEAIPMYNLPETKESRHPKGRGNGYVLTMEGKRIYISGDTEDIVEMRELKDIDTAFICMNLPYTMDINQAADAVLEFKPKVVYPYHYRGKPGMSDIKAFKKLVNEQNKTIDVRLLDWYPQS